MSIKTIGPSTAKIFLVGEAPGDEDEQAGKPYSPTGKSGKMLDQLLAQAGLVRQECLLATVIRERPPGNKLAYFFEDAKCSQPKPILQKWIAQLKQEILDYRPNIVVGLGWIAQWVLTGERSILKFRGFVGESTLVSKQKVICTYEPYQVHENWELHFTAIMDLRKAVRHSDKPDLPVDDRVLCYTPSKNQFIDYCKYLLFEHKEPVAMDVEVAMPSSHIDIVGLAASAKNAMTIEILRNKQPRFNLEDEADIWLWIARVLKEKPIITHNGSYDVAVLWHHLHLLCNRDIFDTQVAFHIVWPEIPRSLGYASSICLDVPAWKHTQQTESPAYNCADAANTYGVRDMMQQKLTEYKMWHSFDKEIAQMFPAIMLQLQGIYVSKERQHEYVYGPGGIVETLAALETKMESAFGKRVNIGSHQQLKNLLYQDMGLPPQYKRRKSITEERKLTSDAEALGKLRRISNNPLLDDILEWKKLTKRRGFIEVSTDADSRVHTSYNITGARMQEEKKGYLDESEDDHKSFGRWSSSKSIILPYGSGNLQNIPKPARKIYTAPEGYEYVQADYVQAEAVVVAYEINDVQLKDMFQESFQKSRTYRDEHGLDLHKRTAAQMFQIFLEDVTPSHRKIGKLLRHANNYSAGPGVLAAKLEIPLAEAKKLMERYHNQCPQLRLWHKKLRLLLEKTRTLTNLLGRKHRFFERWGDDLFRSAYSFIPQSTVGDLLNEALVSIYDEFGDTINLCLQLHDAVYVLSRIEDRPRVLKTLRDSMLRPLTSSLGEEYMIDVDFAVGSSWGEMEELDDPNSIIALAA